LLLIVKFASFCADSLFQSFPELAADFNPPDWVRGNTFSSVLRVTSSDVALWMHYDVFDNLLYQVSLLLLAPQLCPHRFQRTVIFGFRSVAASASPCLHPVTD
jgi:hypothetical protein